MKTSKHLSQIERSQLGAKARAQREHLGLTRNTISAEIGTSELNLLNWEKAIPKKQIDDHRWEQALRVPSGWLRDPTATVTYTQPIYELKDSVNATFVDNMRGVFAWYARQNPTRRTCDPALLTPSEVRTIEIMLQRYGVLGEDQSTLQMIGDRQGLTRERVRQITDKVIERFGDKSVSASVLMRLRAAIELHVPCKVADLDVAVRDILGENLSIEGAERFAREVLGCSIVRLVSGSGALSAHQERMAISSSAPDELVVHAVRQAAQSMVRTTGAAQVFFVAGAASGALGRGVMPQEVIQCCRMFGNFEWLAEEDGWFWFGFGPDNRAKSCALKILSVADRNVDIEEIYGAMSRARLNRYNQDRARPFIISAPLPILQEVLARIPEIVRVQYNDFRLDERIKSDRNFARAYLSETEIAIRDVILANGGIASRRTLVTELVDIGGMLLITLNMALDCSPVVRRLDSGVWAMTGTKLSPSALLGSQRQMVDIVLIDGWREIEVTIPKSAFERGDWFVSSAAAAFLTVGEYAVDGYSEPAFFVHTEKGNPTLKRFIRKLVTDGGEINPNFFLGIHESERRLRIRYLEPNEAAH